MLSEDLMTNLKEAYRKQIGNNLNLVNFKILQKDCNDILSRINFTCVLILVPIINNFNLTCQLIIFNEKGSFVDNVFLIGD